MKKLGIPPARLAVVVVGLIAIFEEWKGVQEETLWNYDFASVVMGVLYLITLVGIIITIRRLIRGEKTFASPTMLLAAAFVVLVWGHRAMVEAKEKLPNIYTAWTQDIGGDGGLYLYFKADGYLSAQKQDQWQVTYYRGSYARQGDSLLLNMPADFPVGSIAIVEGNTLRFPGFKAFFEFRQK